MSGERDAVDEIENLLSTIVLITLVVCTSYALVEYMIGAL